MRSVALVLLLMVLLGSIACESAPPPGPGSPPPGDLAINATVLRGPGSPAPDRVERRGGRWLLLPDGSLRAEAWLDPDGPQPDHHRRPGVVRTLPEAEVAELWSLAGRLGLADPSRGQPAGNLRSIEPGVREIVQIIEFQGAGRAWAFVSRRPLASDSDPVLSAFIRALAERAWMPDEPAELAPAAAIRYDFGPDPYARYRPAPSGGAR